MKDTAVPCSVEQDDDDVAAAIDGLPDALMRRVP
jgi:hypothetical protein